MVEYPLRFTSQEQQKICSGCKETHLHTFVFSKAALKFSNPESKKNPKQEGIGNLYSNGPEPNEYPDYIGSPNGIFKWVIYSTIYKNQIYGYIESGCSILIGENILIHQTYRRMLDLEVEATGLWPSAIEDSKAIKSVRIWVKHIIFSRLSKSTT